MAKQAYVRLPSGMVIETERPDLWKEGERIPAAEGARLKRAEAFERMSALLQPGNRVYTKVETVARSGMSRTFSVYVARVDAERGPWIQRITADVARLIGARVAADGALVMQGGGMDMGFETVYRLGQALWPKGTPSPHGTRNGEPDTAGGYALKQEAL